MKLKEYIEQLQAVEKEHPDLEVIYSADDEGNSFDRVYFAPTLGHFTDNREFYAEDELGDYADEEPLEINAVCIN